jgi:hypothetical protein
MRTGRCAWSGFMPGSRWSATAKVPSELRVYGLALAYERHGSQSPFEGNNER